MEQQLAVRSMDEVERAAGAMVKSGYFQDAREASQAVVKILAGQEMGFGPFASMTGIYIIQGRPSIGANLMAAAVKASRRYNYRVMEMTDTACEIAYFEGGQECGRSRFTIEDARKAGTKNTDKFPRNMLFARAMSNGCRWYCPDIFNGSPTYTPEELGANVNEAGEVIDIPVIISQPEQPKPAPRPAEVVVAELYGEPAPRPNKITDLTPQPEIAQAWKADVLTALAGAYALTMPRLTSTLKYCNLPKSSTLKELTGWMEVYKAHRASGEEPAIAANSANEQTNH